jgi:HEAT repeat protein
MASGFGLLRRVTNRRPWLLDLIAIAAIGALLWLGYRRWTDPVGDALSKLRAGAVAERRQAARDLARLGTRRRDEVVVAMIEALRDDDPAVRIGAAEGLEALIPFLEYNPPNIKLEELDRALQREAAQALMAAMEADPDPAVRRAAAKRVSLFLLEASDVPALLARSRDPNEDPEVRSSALLAGYGADRPPRESCEAVRDALGDPIPRIRVAGYSVLRLGRSEFPIAEAELIDVARRGLEDPDPAVRFEASWLIPGWHQEASVPPWRTLVPAIFAALDRATTPRERLWLLRVLSVPARGTEHAPRALAAIVEELRTIRENSTDLRWLANALRNLKADAIPAIPALIAIRPRFQDQPLARDRLSADREIGELIGWLSALSVTLHASGALAR